MTLKLAMTATFAATTLLLAADGAQARDPACAPRAQVVAKLAERYGETRQSIGLNGADTLVEVFASDETGTWTITATTVAGLTCLIASGQAFDTLTEALPTRESDA
ncbi:MULTISPECIES: hypothetical protein [Salipiger]|jgi:hypothetical protein|uniref:Uncharacterized protein n=1 Tax=Salipiger profundus TaxID=1229727 RepID=A0A1U7D1A2_9RHOB|nr:hypothetical protein Ga0080559_TMP1138 [Salipiger profundus]GGA06315.1 hypothetical protein GCM10011326_17530 [Salipiger profundus]SFC37666.1 hypothetical protein SAMN05444415_103122 [Salipiger profundus]